MDEDIRKLAGIISEAKRIVGFTGAGISTESGISDYRSKGGLWNRFTPVYFDEFLRDEEKRRLYWRRKIKMWPSLRDARPNAGHNFFTSLHARGKLKGIITQNIDGLHEKSGVPRGLIVRIHGTNSEIICLGCGRILPAAEVMEGLAPESAPPHCEVCGSLLKPNTISFGQNLEPSELARADRLATECDLMLCLGSTLVVYPAAEFPARAKQLGARLAIVTLSETPLDGIADVVINRPIGEVVGELAKELDGEQ